MVLLFAHDGNPPCPGTLFTMEGDDTILIVTLATTKHFLATQYDPDHVKGDLANLESAVSEWAGSV